MRNICLRVAYDGTHYAGWQIQPTQPTIQGVLEQAILEITKTPTRVLSAGRTDSGVHALGQIANFHTDFPIPPHKWRAALKSKLPPEIVILESSEVAPEFHSTFSAISKRYRYHINNDVVDNPFQGKFAWRISQPLDHAAMQEAAQILVGKHDFRSFESDWPNKATSVRTVKEITIQRCHAWNLMTPFPLADQEDALTDEGRFVTLEIEADGFLYNMVRAITGTLVNVGRGTWTKNDVERILLAQDRSIAGSTAPAHGLFMVQVHYPPELLCPPVH